jgi:tRNA(adenine34) deaminase
MKNEELDKFMNLAIALATEVKNDLPIAAIVIDENGNIIGKGVNTRVTLRDPVGHAEINAIIEASKVINNWRLDGSTIFVTLEPCAMCAGAIAQTRISRLVFGAWDEKAGAVGSVWDVIRDPRAIHKIEVISGIAEEKCASLLTQFFTKGNLR